MKNTSLLILDDLGQEHSSPWAYEKLYQIIVHRHNTRLPTVLTSMLDFSDESGPIGSRVRDPSVGQLIRMDTPDFRIKARSTRRRSTKGTTRERMVIDQCTFCDIVTGRIPARVRHEEDDIFVFDNQLDWAPTMLLLIPKAHLTQSELWQSGDLLGKIGALAVKMGSRLCPNGYRILSNFDHDAMQTQDHGHIHVVGGTHLYVKAFLDGLFEGPDPDPGLRAELEAMDPIERRAELERVDPEAAARIHRNDHRRTIRAIEVHRLTGRPISALQEQWDTGIARRDCVLVGLDWPTGPINRRINARVGTMIERGLVAEARRLWEADRLGPTAREALGYKQLAAHFRGECSLDQAIERIKIQTRRFGKNQRTWLRRLRRTPASVWIHAAAELSDDWVDIVLRCLGLARNAER